MSTRSLDSTPIQHLAVPKQNTGGPVSGPPSGARQAFQNSLNRVAVNSTADHLRVQYAPARTTAGAPTGTVTENLQIRPSASEQETENLATEAPADVEASTSEILQDAPEPLLIYQEAPRQLESHGMVSTTHCLHQPVLIPVAGIAESAHGAAPSDATTGLLTCDNLAGMLERLGAVDKMSGFQSFELVDSPLGLKSVQIGTNGTAGWAIRLLTDRVSRDQLRRQGSELHTALSERGYRVASISVVGVGDAEGASE